MSKGLEDFNNYIVSRLKVSDFAFIDVHNAVEQVRKKLKSFDVIISKHLNPDDFILCNYTLNDKKWLSYEEYKKAYMRYYEDDEYLLLEEEYDLLKEVLLCH